MTGPPPLPTAGKAPKVPVPLPLQRRRAYVLYFFQGLFAIAILAFLVPMGLQSEPMMRGRLLALAFAGIAGTLVLSVMTRLGHIAIASWLQVFIIWLAPFCHMAVAGGLYSDGFVGWPMAIVVAGLLLGRPGGIIVGVFSILGGLLLTLLWLKGSIAPAIVQSPWK